MLGLVRGLHLITRIKILGKEATPCFCRLILAYSEQLG